MANNKKTESTFSALKDVDRERLEDFSKLLETISTINDKKKSLWKHIYYNAIEDRTMASIAFTDLYKDVHTRSDKHAIHGQTLSKYLERVSKSNDQLLKLAELIGVAEEEQDSKNKNSDSPEDIYDKISSDEIQ